MTGPEINGTLRRSWRYHLLTTISDDDGNFDPDLWDRLTGKVAQMVAMAQEEAWDEANQTARDCGWLTDRDIAEMGSRNPYRVTEETS